MPQIWIDGKFYEKDEAKVSVFDHGLLYGDGVFEGIRAYNGRVFRLKQHLDRLYASAKAILLDIPMAQDAMTAMVLECMRVNQLSDAYIRLVVTRGVGDLGLDPRKCVKPSIICIADKIALFAGGGGRDGAHDDDGADARESPRGAESAGEVAQLPGAHPGQDRRRSTRAWTRR